MAEKNKKPSAFEKEQYEAATKVVNYKTATEANIVSIFYKSPDELYNTNLQTKDFSNNIWRVYFQIAYDIILNEKKGVLDEVTVGLYLEKHPKLKAKFDEYGGYKSIATSISYVKVENLEGYINELRKWNAVLKLIKRGFPVKSRLSDFVDMSAEEIYGEFEVLLNDTFANIDSDVKSYDITDGIHELIDELDEGIAVGLPYADMPMLSKETGGQYLGSITLLGGMSNAGKEQPVTEPILTKNGWTPMGQVTIGTQVYGRDGKLHNVVNVFPQGVKKVYEVTFNDGTKTRCGLEHLWKVYTAKQRNKNNHIGCDKYYKVIPLSEIIKDYKIGHPNQKYGRKFRQADATLDYGAYRRYG